jgi:hypothetical protein
VNWTGSTDPQSGVAYYKIYRGPIFVGTSTTPTYSDNVVMDPPPKGYLYHVSAVNNDGVEGEAGTLAIVATGSLNERLLRLMVDPALLTALRWPVPETIASVRVEPDRLIIRSGASR